MVYPDVKFPKHYGKIVRAYPAHSKSYEALLVESGEGGPWCTMLEHLWSANAVNVRQHHDWGTALKALSKMTAQPVG